MLPPDLQELATRWMAFLPGRDSLPLNYATLPGRTQDLTPWPAAQLPVSNNNKKILDQLTFKT